MQGRDRDRWKMRSKLPYLTINGVALSMGITPGAVVMLSYKGALPPLQQVGTRKMFNRKEIERYQRDMKQTSRIRQNG